MRKLSTKEDVCLNDFTVFQVPTEENRINVTVGTLPIAPVVVGAQEIHTATLIIITYSGGTVLGYAPTSLPQCCHTPRGNTAVLEH